MTAGLYQLVDLSDVPSEYWGDLDEHGILFLMFDTPTHDETDQNAKGLYRIFASRKWC